VRVQANMAATWSARLQPKGKPRKEEPVFRKLLKKRTALVLGAVAVLAVAGIAVAYWTTSGSGSGSGAVAESNGTLKLEGTITNPLTPGGSSPVAFKADNSNSSSLRVGTVKAVVTIDEAHANCKASDFTIADTTENQVIAAHSSGVALEQEGEISMADTAANQDACQGATISLALSS
jgi:hypothetical protein